MDIEKIFNLIKKVEDTSFDRIEIQTQDIKLSLAKNCAAGGLKNAQDNVSPFNESLVNDKAAERQTAKDEVIKSPIAGVFYVAKEPGAEPFVKSGDKVNKGDTVCIIEAMKMMNEVCAPKPGTIECVLASDGQVVSADESLFIYAKEE